VLSPSLTTIRPPAPTLAALPVALTSLVGRDDEVGELREALGDARLVTLTGPGGCGKTRLALAAVSAGAADFPDGVWWVDLSTLADPDLVGQATAAVLQLREVPTELYAVSIARRIAAGRSLLVLDNCEHVVDGCRELAQTLLTACPALRILLTSRQTVGLGGEMVRAVPPLSVPEAEVAHPAELERSDAARLFVSRARAVRAGFRVTERNASAVGRVCQLLDGLPLALELAAARMRILTVEEIAASLDDPQRLLVDGTSRSGFGRHRTLADTLDWSHRLLSPPEAVLFRRLAAFPAGATLEALRFVATGGEVDPDDLLDLLERLADKSLLRVRERDGRARYELLHTVRRYAQRRLAESTDRDAVPARHVRWCLELAEQAADRLTGATQRDWVDRLEAELDNLRAALTWCQEQGESAVGLRLAGLLWRFCCLRGHYGEGRQWLERALTVAGEDGQMSAAQAAAVHGAGVLAFLQCDYELATERLRTSLRAHRALRDDHGVASVLQYLGSIAREQGDYRRARDLHEESLALWRAQADESGVARCVYYLAFTAWLEADLEQAASLAQDALRRYRRIGDPEGIASALIVLAEVAVSRGDLDGATALLEESHRLSEEIGFREGVAYSLHELGAVARRRGEMDAVGLLVESLRLHRDLGDRWRMASVLEELAAYQQQRAQPGRAAQVLGAAEAIREEIGTSLPPCELADHDRMVEWVFTELGDDAAGAAWASGRTRELESVLAATLTEPPPVPAPPSEASSLDVTALGRSDVRLGGRRLTTADWTYAKPRELLYFLLSKPGCTKAQIGLALWPEKTASELRSALHTALHHLRRALGSSESISFADGRYAVSPDLRLRYDVNTFESGLAAARGAGSPDQVISDLQQAIAAYGGDFLVDLPAGEWAQTRRLELRHSFEQALLALGRLLAEAGRLTEAAQVYQRALAHDPLLEVAHRELMRCYARQGERGQALRQYDVLRRRLADELDVEPAPATSTLHQRIRSDWRR
jgi:predicted ATPase/two-component SAPR family response regulator